MWTIYPIARQAISAFSTAKKSVAAPIIITHTTIRKMSAAILISTGCIICAVPAYASPRDKTLLSLVQIPYGEG